MTKIIDTDDDDVEPYSSYWMGDDTDDADDTRILKLASIRRAISNFVYILTNDKSIQVKFSSGTTSYTDGKTVVISADDSPDSFDATVGLALHEGAHCLLSNFQFLRIISENVDTFHSALCPELQEIFTDRQPLSQFTSSPNFDDTMKTLRTYMMNIMNIIEDRRIDSYVYRNASGYRPYYDAMYTEYHFTSDIAKNLKYNPDWRVPTIENYMTWILLMISPEFTTSALPALDEIIELIDLDTIHRLDNMDGPRGDTVFEWTEVTLNKSNLKLEFEYDQFSELWKLSNKIMLIILKHSKFYSKQNNTPFEFDDRAIDIENMSESNLPNLDIPKGKFNDSKGRKSINKITELMNGTNRRKKLTQREQDQIFSIESADARIHEYQDSMLGIVPVLVTRKLTNEVLYSNWFPFGPNYLGKSKSPVTYSYSVNGIEAGVRMGQLLAHRLQVRNDPTITHFTRKEHGKIDRRLLAQLGMDITSVFKRTTIDQYRPAMLHLSLDASSSMAGGKWERVMTVATALAYAADKIRNLDVVITMRGTTKSDMPVLSIVYDSRVDKFHKVRSMFPYLRPRNRTPEGLTFLASMNIIKECVTTHRVYFVNFSDGEPMCTYKYNGVVTVYEKHLARPHSKKMVQEIRNSGISILSYFISHTNYDNVNSWTTFREIYGADAQRVDVESALTVLRTLNKLLITKE